MTDWTTCNHRWTERPPGILPDWESHCVKCGITETQLTCKRLAGLGPYGKQAEGQEGEP